jgi:hypothetical protein
MAKACIICAKTVPHGFAVEDDMVISGIRAIKQKLGIAKNNELVVCPDCVEEYKKKRGEYEKRLVQHVVIASVVLLVFVLLPIFTTGFSLWAVVLGVVFAAGVMLLSVFAHCPKVPVLDSDKAAQNALHQAKKSWGIFSALAPKDSNRIKTAAPKKPQNAARGKKGKR